MPHKVKYKREIISEAFVHCNYMYLLKLVHNNYLFFFFWILLNKTNNAHVVVYHCPLYIHTSYTYSCMIGSFKEAITFESVERSLWCDHSNETYIVFGIAQCTCLFFSIIITFFWGGGGLILTWDISGSDAKTRKQKNI